MTARVLRVLGPCVLTVAGATVELTGAQRRLLSRLAMAAPREVGLASLIDAVWPDRAPTTARAAVQNQISRIRAVAGDAIIRTTASGYVLDADVDARRLLSGSSQAHEALGGGELDTAFTLADEAVALWEGLPLGDLDHVPDVEPIRRSLFAAVNAAENTRLDAAIRLERRAWALPEAERLCGLEPGDEYRWALLVRALVLNGRRGDALGAVHRARRLLRDEFGLEPGPELRELEVEILGPDAISRLELSGPIVGRGTQLAAVFQALRSGSTTVLVGEPGIGLSKMLREVRVAASRSGFAVALAGCRENPDTAVSVLDDLLAELGLSVSPDLGTLNGFVPALAQAAVARPIAVIVDDAQFAGPSSVAVLAAAGEVKGVSVIVGTHAHDRQGSALAAASTIELTGLDVEAVSRVVERWRGQPVPPATTAWLTRFSGGNPLFLACFLADTESMSELERLAAVGGPARGTFGLRQLGSLVRRRIDFLNEAERHALEFAAVAGDGFPLDLVAALTSIEGVTGLIAGDLLEPTLSDQVRFRHGAVRSVAYAEIPPGRRQELHHSLGAAARERGIGAGAVARHLLAASSLDPAAALRAAMSAAEAATAVGAHRDAVDWLQQAMTLNEQVGADARTALATSVALGDALRLAGDPQHLDVLIRAADRAVALGDEDLLGAAAFALLQLGGASESGAVNTRAADLAEIAMASVTDPELSAQIAAAASLTWSLTGDAGHSRDLFDQGLGAARTSASRRKVLPFAYLAIGMPSDLPRRRELATELVGLGHASGDPVALFEGFHLSFSVALMSADGRAARSVLADMHGLIDEVGDVGRRWALLYQGATIAHLDDDLDRCEELAGQAYEIFSPVSPSRAAAAFESQLLSLRLSEGREHELRTAIEPLIVDQPGVPAWHAAFAVSVVGDSPRVAAHHADRALENVPGDFTWLAGHVVGGRAAALAGDRRSATEYLRRLAPWSGLGCWQGTCSYGPVDTTLALLARALGDERGVSEYSARAYRTARALEAPAYLRDIARLGLVDV